MRHVFLMLALVLVGSLSAKESFCYLGVEGGYITGMGRATFKRNVGPDAGILVAFNPIPRAGFDAGANLGVKLPCFLRTEVAYTFQHQSYDWKEFVFNTPPPQAFPVVFNAKLDSHLFFWNNYIHINDVCGIFQPYSDFDPYLLGGLGVAINHLHNIHSFNLSSQKLPDTEEATLSQLAFSFGIGMLSHSSSFWIIDTMFRVTYLGEVRSGNTIFGNPPTPIRPYRFENNWIGTFNLGIKLCRS